MKLIVTFQVTDNYTYSNDIIVPVEYESEEAFLVYFEAAVLEEINKTSSLVKFLGDYFVDSFYDFKKNEIIPVEVFTLEDWFERNKINTLKYVDKF